MYRTEHPLRETCQYFLDREATITEQAEEKAVARRKEIEDFRDQLDAIRKQRELTGAEFGKFTESVYDNHLQTALEAIYITALSKDAVVTEDCIELAHSLVSNYIKEQGGAREIIAHKSGKTYLLDTIFEAVDSAAQRDINFYLEAEKDDEEDEKDRKKEKEEDGSDEVDKEDIKLGDADGDGVDDSQDSDFGTGEDNDKNEEASDAKEKSDEKEDKEDEEKDDKEDKESDKEESDNDSESDDDDSDSEDEDDEDSDEDIDIEDLDQESNDSAEDDEEDEDDSDEESEEDDILDKEDTKESIKDAGEPEDLEGNDPEETEELPTSKEELFDKLENDQEVTDAVDIIAKRISDAEAKFIEKNAEDKKKIENIVNKVQDRIDAVTQDENSTEEDIEKEENDAKLESTRLINQVRNDRFHTVYEMMVRDNMEYIMKDHTLTEAYSEEGKLDMSRIMDSSRTMYGWLETVNTIQLEKVNEGYIQKVLEGKI